MAAITQYGLTGSQRASPAFTAKAAQTAVSEVFAVGVMIRQAWPKASVVRQAAPLPVAIVRIAPKGVH